MSTPPVPPSHPNDSASGGQYGQQPAQYAQEPQYGQAPQYGQPQYAQPQQFGQQQHAQPQQFGQQQYLVYPSEMPQQRTTASSAAPPLVNVSFWLVIVACLLWVGSIFVSMGSIDDPALRSQMEARLATSGADVDFEAIRGVIVGMVVLIAAFGVLMYALVAFNIRKGRNWARVLGTIFAAFSLLGIFENGPGLPSILAGAAAMVLLYLPAAAPFFRKYHPFASPYAQPGVPYGR